MTIEAAKMEIAFIESAMRHSEQMTDEQFVELSDRYNAAKAFINSERDEIMSTPFSPADAIDATAEAETELAGKEIIKMTTTTKTAKSYNEAMELVKEFHARRPDCYFVYRSENYGDDYKNECNEIHRFFGGMGKDGYGICFTMIEIVKDGKLDTVRVINTYRNTAIDIKIEIEPETTAAEVKTTREKFLAAREEIVCRSGRYLGNGKFANQWQRYNGFRWYNISKKTAAVDLESYYGLTIYEYLAEQEQWIQEGLVRGAKRMAIELQAEYLKDKIARESKPSEETFSANVLPVEDDADDELIDEAAEIITNVEPPADNFTTELAKLEAAKLEAEAKEQAAKAVYEAAADETEKHRVELQNFLDKHASRLCDKLQALAPTQTMQLITTRGTTEFCRDFTDLYVDAMNYPRVEFVFRNWYGRSLACYDTPAQVEAVISMLKAAIARGDKEFTFPTVEELTAPSELKRLDARMRQIVIEREECFDALNDTDNDIPQQHIDYLKGQLRSLLKEYNELRRTCIALKNQKGVA